MEHILLSPLPLSKVEVNPLDKFIEFLCVLEGYKSKIKNLHWAARKLSNYSFDNIHKRLDDLLDIVIEFQDSLAEKSMGILGDMDVNVIKGCNTDQNDPIYLIDDILNSSYNFYPNLMEMKYCGIKSELELFIANLNNQKYLFKLCLK